MGFDIVSYLMGAKGAGFGEKPFDLVSYLLGQSDYSVVERTASGAVAHITDAIAAPFKGIVAQITPVQSGSGDPSPTNVRPISGWSTVHIYHAGKNLLDPSTVEQGTITSDGPGSDANRCRTAWDHPIRVNPGMTLTVSGSVSSGTFNAYMGVYADSSTTTRVASSGWLASGGSYTVPSDGHYVRITLRKASNGNVNPSAFSSLQLEVGSSPTEYTPYDATAVTFAIPSDPGTVYGGTLAIAEDGSVTLTKTMGYVNLGTFTWSLNSAGGGHAFKTSIASRKVGLGTQAICEGYKFAGNFTLDNIANGPDMQLYFQRTNTNIWIKDSNFSDASTLKTSLSGVHLVYELAEPTVYTMTPITPLTALRGVNNIWADSGDISVTYITDGRASNQLAVSMLLGRSYQHDPADPDDATAAEALSILTGGDTR